MNDNLLDFDAQAMERHFAALGEKAFRARQVLRWIHQYGESDFARMSDLAKDLRAKLALAARVEAPAVVADDVAPDGTRKWLLRVDDSNSIESVFIPEDDRGTLCVSSQVGCKMGCAFCETGQMGLLRHLTTEEIIAQLLIARHRLGWPIRNIVFMGMGEALDNPINYFTAQGLSSRANDLNSLLDSMTTGINTIQAANNGISAITKLVQSAQSLVSQGRQTTDSAVRATLSAQFDTLLGQIDQLAADSGFNGINLLNGDNLTINLNETGSSTTTITGYTDTTASDLGISGAANNWAASTDLDAAAGELSTALTTLRTQTQSLGSNLQTVQIRQDFTKAMVNTLSSGADSLTLADTNEEGANLLALQTRQQLSTTALSLAAQADQNVLRLFQ